MHYALCTALDEAASHTEWRGGSSATLGAWQSNALASAFHHDREGGTKVFLILGRLADASSENIQPIEVYYHILSLGFEGRYRGLAHGDEQLYTLRKRLHDLLNKHYGPPPRALSPNCEPAPAGRLAPLYSVSPWVTAAVLSVAIAGQWAWYKYELVLRQRDLVREIEAIGNMTPPPLPAPPKSMDPADLPKDKAAHDRATAEKTKTKPASTSF